jgi:hypothetical protein
MSLVRSWRAAVLRASGAVLLVPVGLLLAVGIAASLTGLGGIGSIGQLVAGPGLPPASVAEARSGAGTGDELSGLPTVPSLSRATARRRSGEAGLRLSPERGARRRTQRRGRPPSARRPGSTRPPSRSPSRRPSAPPGGTAPPPAGPSPSEPLPGPPRPTGLIRRIGAQVDRIVRPLPAVGPAAADAVNTVVQLLDPPPSQPPPSPSGKLLGPTG